MLLSSPLVVQFYYEIIPCSSKCLYLDVRTGRKHSVGEQESILLPDRISAYLSAGVADVKKSEATQMATRTVPASIGHGLIVGGPTEGTTGDVVVVFLGPQIDGGVVQHVLSSAIQPCLHQRFEVLRVAEDACVSADAAQRVGVLVVHGALGHGVAIPGVVARRRNGRPLALWREKARVGHVELCEGLPDVRLVVTHVASTRRREAGTAGQESRGRHQLLVVDDGAQHVVHGDEGQVRVHVLHSHWVLQRLIHQRFVDAFVALEVFCWVVFLRLCTSKRWLPVSGNGVWWIARIMGQQVHYANVLFSMAVVFVSQIVRNLLQRKKKKKKKPHQAAASLLIYLVQNVEVTLLI